METETKVGGFTLLPCAKDVCQECAVKHEHWQAHNQQSMYYQYHFYGQYGRWPTWTDAIAHCPPSIQKQWIEQLALKDIKAEKTEHK